METKTKMFNDIGKKIKSLARILCVLGITASVLLGAAAIVGMNSFNIPNITASLSNTAYGILIAFVGSIFSWVSNFVLYGFGELVDKTAENEKKTADILMMVRGMAIDLIKASGISKPAFGGTQPDANTPDADPAGASSSFDDRF